jgi:predicted TIM-barrel fold metal-dependent hydrolase
MGMEYKVICADSHVNPPHDFWQEYLPQHLRDLAPRIEAGDDADYVIFEGTRRKLSLIASQAGRAGKDFKAFGRRSDMRAGGWMPGERLKDMDTDGVDAIALFGGGPLGTRNPELYMASFDAYNRWLADFCSYEPKRLAGVAYLPMVDVADTIERMKAAAKLGYRACNIPAFPQSALTEMLEGRTTGGQMLALTGDPNGKRQYRDPEFDPLWETAVDLDMSITIHLGARAVRFDQKEHFLSDLLASKLSMADPVSIMVFGAVFQRHPKLRFVTVESGSGWMAFAADYMDRTWEKQRYWTDSPLQEYPSFYMDQNVYSSFIHDAVGIATRHFPGAKNIMWSSDYPHSETTFPNSQDMIDRLFKGVPEEDKAEIICKRAQRVYGIGT